MRRRLHWASRLELPLLTALIAGAKDPVSLATRLQLPLTQQRNLKGELALDNWLKETAKTERIEDWLPSTWCQALENQPWLPAAIALAICKGIPNWKHLLRWWEHWRHLKSPIQSKTLIKEGWQPGPGLGAELQRLRLEHIDQQESSS